MKRILFVCTFYGARALVAEQFAKAMDYADIEVCSAAFEQGRISSRIYKLLAEKGMAADAQPPRLVWDRFNDGERFDLVVTMCSDSTSEQCPVFNANIDTLYGRVAKIQHWSIPDFSSIEGDETLWFEQARQIRDLIGYKVGILLQELTELPA